MVGQDRQTLRETFGRRRVRHRRGEFRRSGPPPRHAQESGLGPRVRGSRHAPLCGRRMVRAGGRAYRPSARVKRANAPERGRHARDAVLSPGGRRRLAHRVARRRREAVEPANDNAIMKARVLGQYDGPFDPVALDHAALGQRHGGEKDRGGRGIACAVCACCAARVVARATNASQRTINSHNPRTTHASPTRDQTGTSPSIVVRYSLRRK